MCIDSSFDSGLSVGVDIFWCDAGIDWDGGAADAVDLGHDRGGDLGRAEALSSPEASEETDEGTQDEVVIRRIEAEVRDADDGMREEEDLPA